MQTRYIILSNRIYYLTDHLQHQVETAFIQTANRNGVVFLFPKLSKATVFQNVLQVPERLY